MIHIVTIAASVTPCCKKNNPEWFDSLVPAYLHSPESSLSKWVKYNVLGLLCLRLVYRLDHLTDFDA